MIKHIVFFRLKDGSPENIAKTKDVLMSMEGKIPEVHHLEVGMDVIRSERSYDLSLIVEVDSLEDLDKYQVHPVHKEIIEYIAQVKESVVAVDYEV
ncbi:Dabb family protein [Chengkuizengella axinellae]|uniref:Dabb family protein n=1 Tax=Chengkuizengella axinellae TaxID=3064388 RepID=A0ABT9J2A5_9BACL|nr:Dabb family protein [Chengkuizengella sp. 2205SS18-9]MDP5275727.1 Dabb family protein [Chengkuizengella sp. 2205SS18-9]